jgi:Mrp family chromosome partitioning ATPase
MVVELDMRRPSIARVLGLKEPVQFSEALAEKEPPEDHLLRYGTNLIFAVNQSSKRHSAELLQGSTAAAVLDRLEAAYAPDVMIFDTPPLLVSDDTLAFLDQIDCALLVAEAERTRPAEVDKCEHELAARTNVLGVVLNKCRYLDRSDSYGYYGY